VILEHRGARPTIDPSAYVAPTAVVCGDVTVGAGARVRFGAVLSAEDVLIGPQAHREDRECG
jgi:carbonic anhydrase/acetyltransferase-like protein (isoleucine patch superfamily)